AIHSLNSSCSSNRPSATTPLFPYTTPSDLIAAPRVTDVMSLVDSLVEDLFSAEAEIIVRPIEQLFIIPSTLRLPMGRQGQLQALDRKSTRLNSSHVKISYAVFCLKQKKTLV